jgi:uncharacterized protein YjiS (DUF1127 family)
VACIQMACFPSVSSERCGAMLDHLLTKAPRFIGQSLVGLAKGVCRIVRRIDERRKLSELSPCEWRDLGIHQVRKELTKRPWAD